MTRPTPEELAKAMRAALQPDLAYLPAAPARVLAAEVAALKAEKLPQAEQVRRGLAAVEELKRRGLWEKPKYGISHPLQRKGAKP